MSRAAPVLPVDGARAAAEPDVRTSAPGNDSDEGKAVSWGAFFSIYFPAMLLALGTGIALPAIPVIARSFDVGFGLASFVITSFLLGGMVGTLPTGWIIDRFGRRPVMIAGPILTAVMALLVMTAHTFPELLLYRFLDGWAAQMWLLGRLARISFGAASNQRGRQVTWMYGMDNIGRLSGPLAGGFIAAQWGERSPFAAYAVLALLALIPTIKLTPEVHQPRARSAGPKVNPLRSIGQLVLPRLPLFGVALFAAMARGPIFAGMMHLYAAYAYQLDPKTIGVLATATSIMALPVSFTSGWFMDRFGRKITMVPGFLGVAVTMLAVAVTAFLRLPLGWYVAAFLATAAAQSLTGGSVQTIGTDVAPDDARGMFLGLWRFVGQVGTAASPSLFAFLADSFGYGYSFVYVALTAVIVLVLLVGYVPDTRTERVAA
jgi:MFS family permease